MPRLITLSRAARLVGVKRGALQRRIQAGELRTFEGELLLSDLLQAYPQTSIEDTTMLERVEQIMEQAVNKIIRPAEDAPDTRTLAARILALGKELGEARQQARRYRALADDLKKKFDELSPADDKTQEQAFSTLKQWFLQVLETMETPEEESGIIAKEAFLRVMAAQVRILPSGHEFFVDGADSILEAGLRGGLALNYGCSNGNCGLCKCKVVSGQVNKIKSHDYVLTEAEKGLGYILACSNTAVTDVVLEADEALGSHDIPAQEIDIKVKKIEQPDDRIILVHARTPRTTRLRFLAGQYLSLEVEGMPALDCSIASCPCDDMNLQFHIPNISGNQFSEKPVNSIRPNSSITIKGPLGDFTLNEDSPRSLVFIAGNAGFGPIKSLIEHAMALDTAEKISLYWITTPGNSHYLGNLCRSWDDALENFSYTAMEATETRSVEQLLPEIINDLGDTARLDYYACLPAPLLDTTETFLLDSGIPASQLRMEPVRQQPSD
ncbi:MAG: 2Fe-2S iron-sulfur cluster binding domain-containing protein [Gammaproteobacteria bacterium]|nr:2Fe-2S iron-sulfur cluster binding domain-containing protein [Gammaproteobacteria bacterium]